MSQFTEAEKQACLERELAMRRRVYPRLVAQRRMTREQADREIALMKEIVTDYRMPPLFAGVRS